MTLQKRAQRDRQTDRPADIDTYTKTDTTTACVLRQLAAASTQPWPDLTHIDHDQNNDHKWRLFQHRRLTDRIHVSCCTRGAVASFSCSMKARRHVEGIGPTRNVNSELKCGNLKIHMQRLFAEHVFDCYIHRWASRESDAHQLRRRSLHYSWTSNLEPSPAGRYTVVLDSRWRSFYLGSGNYSFPF